MIEALVLMIYDDVIKGCIGEDYKRYAPYLLTAFFFVLVNNLMGLIPIFPGGANVTGNIAITLVLAVITFFVYQYFWYKGVLERYILAGCSHLVEGSGSDDAFD